MSGWGGARLGAGRKVGWRKPVSEQRPQHQVRAFADEWELIKQFADMVKHGNREACEIFLAKLATKTE